MQQWRTVACLPPGSIWMTWFTCNYITACHKWASFILCVCEAISTHILVWGTLEDFEVRTNIPLMMPSLQFFWENWATLHCQWGNWWWTCLLIDAFLVSSLFQQIVVCIFMQGTTCLAEINGVAFVEVSTKFWLLKMGRVYQDSLGIRRVHVWEGLNDVTVYLLFDEFQPLN